MNQNILILKDYLASKNLISYPIIDKSAKLATFENYINDYRRNVLNADRDNEHEEHFKKILNDFLKSSFNYSVNTHKRIDSVIFNDKRELKTIIEVKRPKNQDEMISDDNFNNKAFHEALLYFYEQKESREFSIDYIIITDCKVVYLISSDQLKILIDKNKKISKLLSGYKNKELNQIKTTSDFYNEASKLLNDITFTTNAVRVDLFDDELDIEHIYRFFDKYHLLNERVENDANSLNKEFYYELLYIMGLEENHDILVKSNTKGSLLDITEEMISHGKKSTVFETALGLNILWLNRILFLKILEAQLQEFRDDENYTILSPKSVTGYHLLSKLFFNILSTARSERHEDDTKYDTIPYLNSSLFEETILEKDYSIRDLDIERTISVMQGSILYNSKSFTDKKLTLLNYLLMFLDSFSFNSDNDSEDTNTVIKSSVLGLVFEKLNGYKDGSHFTPPSITMYMSKEVIERRVIDIFNEKLDLSCANYDELIEYSRGNFYKEALRASASEIIDSITILDPAVGSGHFLVSALNELIRIKSELGLLHKDIRVSIESDELIIKSSFGERFLYQLKSNKMTIEKQDIQTSIFNAKKHIIENQLYGVDINPNSVNIARLRLWIELLKHTYYTDDKYIDLEALPNLEFKIMTANSLIALRKSNTGLVSVDYEPLQNSLQSKFKEYYEAVENKQEIKESITSILDKMKDMIIFDDDSDQARQLADFSPFNTTVSAPFFDSDLMFGVSKFDIVLMNPPYFGLTGNHPYKHLMKTGDIYQIFLETTFEFINSKGIVSAIVSNKWMRAGYGNRTREWLYKNAFVHEILDLGAGWFDSATVDTNIISYSKRIGAGNHQTSIFAQTLSNKVESIPKGKTEAAKNTIAVNAKGDSFIILSEIEAVILAKMILMGKPLKDWDVSINYGIKTGFNEAFIIDTAIKDALIAADSKCAEIIKPLLKDDSIKKYKINFNNKYLINIHNGIKSLNIAPIDINKFPAIKLHIDTIVKNIEDGKIIRKRGHTANNKNFFVRSDIGITPYNLRDCKYLNKFEQEKIIWKQTSKDRTFTIDNNKYFLDVTSQMLTPNHKNVNLKYLVSILNSNISEYFVKKVSTSFSDIGIRWIPAFMEKLPIPVPTKEQETQITALVTAILAKKQAGLDSTDEELQIDALVYALYGLTQEEIKIIEG